MATESLEDALVTFGKIPARWRVGILLFFIQNLRRKLRSKNAIDQIFDTPIEETDSQIIRQDLNE